MENTHSINRGRPANPRRIEILQEACLRSFLGESIDDLANEFGISRATLWRWRMDEAENVARGSVRWVTIRGEEA